MTDIDDPRSCLDRVFGFDRFMPGQEQVIGHLLGGRSAAAVFPTGGGKSLCYQLPALMLPGLTLVASPLIALMKDQIDQLRKLGVAAARLDSTLTLEEHREVMNGVRQGELKLLYVAPERFNNERFRQAMARARLSLLAVDEAHCISEWGHNFRPDYLKLADFASGYGAERVLALTATATPKVLEDVCRGFQIASECAVRTGFYRPNLTLLMAPVTAAQRDQALVSRLRERATGSAIVYVTLQRTSEQVAEMLQREGFSARAYHAGMKDDLRAEVQEWFLGSDTGIVVATIAFGMGIDKPNIRYVYHYNMPKSLENMSQEIGRAGRDGLPSTCEMMFCPDDVNTLQNFAFGDTPSRDSVRLLVKALADEPDSFDLNYYEISARFDIRQLVIRTLLTYLELEGLLRTSTPWYSQYRFQPLRTSEEILQRFEGERRQFLRDLFRQARKSRVWFDIDLDKAAAALGSPRDRLVRALDYLADQGCLELRTAGVRFPFTWLDRPQDLDALADDLHQRTVGHEQREIARLGQVLEVAAHDGCQTNFLCTHFGEPRHSPCGHCSWCLSDHNPVELLPSPTVEIPETIWQQAMSVRQEHSSALREPRAFTRFLTGLTSPSLTRERLSRHQLFGCLNQVPFTEVLRRASQ